MKTNLVSTLILAGLLVVLAACEGEPPKVPTNPPSVPVAEAPEPAVTAGPPGSPSPPPAPGQTDGAATTCHCPCMGGDSHGAMSSGTPTVAPIDPNGSAPTTPGPAQTATAPPDQGAVALHAIVGTVSSVPERAAGTAVVYLEDAGVLPKRGALAGVDNHGMSFSPYVTVVAAGGRVVFSNSDPFPHNVFSPDNERFNLGTVQMKGSTAHTFKSAGVYSLLCNLHPNMLGYVVVSPSSYFAKANAKGQFAIKDVPPGTYKITAWAPRLLPITQSVTLKDADVTTDFALHR